MRRTRLSARHRSWRALTTVGLATFAALGASATPAAATPAISTSVKDVTTTSATICATGIRPAVVTEFGVYTGDDERLAGSTKACNTVSGLEPGTRYIFVFKSGRPGEEASMQPEGEVTFTTQSAFTGSSVVAREITQATAKICKTYVNVAVERAVVYRVQPGQPLQRVAESTGQCTPVTGLQPGSRYTFAVKVGTVGSTGDDGLFPIGSVDLTTLDASGNPVPAPSVTVEQVGKTSAVICGVPGTAQVLRRWVVLDGDTWLNESTNECVLVTGLAPGRTHTLTLKQAPTGAPDSDLVTEGEVTFDTRPLQNGPTRVEAITSTGATVCADGAFFPAVVTRWYVFDGNRELAQGNNPCVKVTGLAPDTSYVLTLRFAFDGSPDVLDTWAEVPLRTLPETSTQTVPYAYDLAGAAALKTLTTGSLPLSGSIKAQITVATGAFTGELSLAQTTGTLVALGFLPVVAKVNLVPTEPVTGTLVGGKLKATAKVRIKLPSVKTFGIELAGGANCQAKQISSIALQSTQPTFLPLSGGPLAGGFAISDLSGCGFLTGIVSPLTKGEGNTIALNLTPKAAG